MQDRFVLEKKLVKKYDAVIGVDEVGRGPLAGPVVAAAVWFPQLVRESWWEEINDSKKISEARRENLVKQIHKHAEWGIGEVAPRVIDKINILNATFLAMQQAVEQLLEKVIIVSPYILVDGRFSIPALPYEQKAIVKGDGLVHSIAAASIIAKVYRDNAMKQLDERFPDYQFAQHKGYGTAAHIAAIKTHGLTPVHRVSFCGNIV